MSDNMNVPQLRFGEFSGEWKSKKLIELSENGFSNGAFNDPKKVGHGYRIINVKDMYADGTISVDDLTRVALNNKEFSSNRVEYGDIFFTRSSLVKEGIAHSNINLTSADDLTFDGHLIRMRPRKEKYSPSFLYYNFATTSTRKQFIVRGKTTTMTTIGQEDISTVKIILPSKPEQQKIATFLTSVDTKIEQLTKKEKLLQEYKKSVMQKIFSQKIRFKDDDGSEYPEWTKKRLEDVFSGAKGRGLSKKDIVENGQNKCILYGELYTAYPEVIGEVKSYTNFTDGVKSKQGDLLIPCSTTTTGIDLADVTAIMEDDVLLGGDISILRFKDKGNSIFFAYYLTYYKKFDLAKFGQGSTIVHLYYTHFKKIDMIFPSSIEEQTKIADFLSSIDSKIEQTQKQLGSTKEFKKALLQQMFV